METSPSPRSTPRLSEVAHRLCIPQGIVASAWPIVEARAATLGVSFDRWQAGLGSLILAKRADGTYAAAEGGVGLSLPRQVGKTYTITWLVFILCLLRPDTTVVWTAHRTRTANETFAAMTAMATSAALAAHVEHVYRANGNQQIAFTNGSRILFGARESGFGRGFAAVDIIVLDESQILTESALDDMVAATNTSSVGLVIMLGTPPRPKDPGEVFRAHRREALAGDPTRLWVELSAGDDIDMTKGRWKNGGVDWRAIARVNPSYPQRTSATAIQRLRKQLPADSFRREVLGVWDKELTHSAAIPADKWTAGQIPLDQAASGPRCFAVRFAVDGSSVAVGAAAKISDTLTLVDGVRMEPMAHGLDWVVDFLTAPHRLAQTAQIVIEGKAGVGFLVDALRRRKVRATVLLTPTMDQAAAAHSLMLQSIRAGQVAHWPNETLDDQVAHAILRPIGKQGGFGWAALPDRSVALLDAVTLAHWAAKTTRRRARG